jgi:hypothetical protein
MAALPLMAYLPHRSLLAIFSPVREIKFPISFRNYRPASDRAFHGACGIHT